MNGIRTTVPPSRSVRIRPRTWACPFRLTTSKDNSICCLRTLCPAGPFLGRSGDSALSPGGAGKKVARSRIGIAWRTQMSRAGICTFSRLPLPLFVEDTTTAGAASRSDKLAAFKSDGKRSTTLPPVTAHAVRCISSESRHIDLGSRALRNARNTIARRSFSSLSREAMTPALEQYFKFKENYPGYILLFRMGDFYEILFEDAVVAAEILGITLTKRGKYNGQDVPMCGVPYHALATYLQRLVHSGELVAICEQVETVEEARKRKGRDKLLKREVKRLVTPGTLTEDAFLSPGDNNYLAAVFFGNQVKEPEVGIAWLDISTGEFYTSPSSLTSLEGDLARIDPKEIVLPDSVQDRLTYHHHHHHHTTTTTNNNNNEAMEHTPASEEHSKTQRAQGMEWNASYAKALGIFHSRRANFGGGGCLLTLRPAREFSKTHGEELLQQLRDLRYKRAESGGDGDSLQTGHWNSSEKAEEESERARRPREINCAEEGISNVSVSPQNEEEREEERALANREVQRREMGAFRLAPNGVDKIWPDEHMYFDPDLDLCTDQCEQDTGEGIRALASEAPHPSKHAPSTFRPLTKDSHKAQGRPPATKYPGETNDKNAVAASLAVLFPTELGRSRALSSSQLAAIAALLAYVRHTQCGTMPYLRPPSPRETSSAMVIDATARQSLEIVKGASGRKKGSLLAAVDSTVTSGGSRLLSSHLSSPSTRVEEINARLEATSFFLRHSDLERKVREMLKNCRDMERSLQRLSLSRGGPRDALAIGSTIVEAREIANVVLTQLRREKDRQGSGFDAVRATQTDKQIPQVPRTVESRKLTLSAEHTATDTLDCESGTRPHNLRDGVEYGDLGLLYRSLRMLADSSSVSELGEEILRAIKPTAPLLVSAGNFIAEGFNEALDEWRRLKRLAEREPETEDDDTFGNEDANQRATDSRSPASNTHSMESLQSLYKEKTKITSLRIRSNNQHGYFVEVPARRRDDVDPSEFYLCHSTKNLVRFKTTALIELESKLRRAIAEVTRIENEIFEALRSAIVDSAPVLSEMARSIALIDTFVSNASCARKNDLHRPIVDYSLDFIVEGGRHLVVEQAHTERTSGGLSVPRAFIPNDICLQQGRIRTDGGDVPVGPSTVLITGPNMGGKSTYLRQNAHIAVLAQAGCFVPAEKAVVGVIDRVFSRVGASDDLANDRSTFLVEMEETASIMNRATRRSLVLMDEVGRGTSTEDGLAIAWSVLEHLCKRQIRSLFASHFLELAQMAATYPTLGLSAMEVVESEDQIIFAHRVVPGVTERSYGLHVARMAGVPPAIIERAEQVLDTLGKKRLEFGQGSGALSHDQPIGVPLHARGGMNTTTVRRRDGGCVQQAPFIPTDAEWICEKLLRCDVEQMTPVEALDLIQELTSRLRQG